MSKQTVQSIAAPKEIWDKAKEIGGGNASQGVRIALELAFPLWEKQQQQRWAERSKKGEGQ